MKKIIIDIDEILPEFIEKDLCDDERICPTCKGVGLVVQDFVFGNEEGKKQHPHKMFPWNRRYIGFCPDCFFGVQKLCSHCNEPYKNRSVNQCDCAGAQTEKFQKEQDDVRKKYEKAEKITYEEAQKRGIGMLYDEYAGKYYTTDQDMCELIEEEFDGGESTIPKWLFGTYVQKVDIDIGSILENATSDLHEDAESNLIDVDELEKFCKSWCNKQSGTETYYPDYKIVVLLEEVKNEGVDQET